MRGTTLLGLTLTCAILIGAVVMLTPNPQAEPAVASLWLPELEVSQVNALTIRRPGQQDIRVERRDGLWVIASWMDFPMTPHGIVNLLRVLTRVRQVEAQSPLAQHRAALGLDERATRLTLERQDHRTLTLLLGKQVRQGGQVVSLPNSEATWLLNENLPLPQSPLPWIDRRLTRIPFERIRQLSLTYPNGARIRITRESTDASILKLRQSPSTPKVMDEAGAINLLRLFSKLDISEIAIGANAQQMVKTDLSFELLTFSGEKLSGQIRQSENQLWLKLKNIEGFDTDSVQPRLDWLMRVEASQLRPAQPKCCK
jgi:hypothetical protein